MSPTAQTSTVYTSQNKQQQFSLAFTVQGSLLWLCVSSLSVTLIIAAMLATAEAHDVFLLTHVISIQGC